MSSNIDVIVGVVVSKDDKYLLVQEAKASCRGKWNLPAGHLDLNETITAGAIREAKEETGCNVRLTGICQIGNIVSVDRVFVSIIFTSELVNEKISFDTDEILDVKWFSYDEIVSMKSKIRDESLMFGAINNVKDGLVAPLDIIKNY